MFPAKYCAFGNSQDAGGLADSHHIGCANFFRARRGCFARRTDGFLGKKVYAALVGEGGDFALGEPVMERALCDPQPLRSLAYGVKFG